jgi:hypothetical protein
MYVPVYIPLVPCLSSHVQDTTLLISLYGIAVLGTQQLLDRDGGGGREEIPPTPKKRKKKKSLSVPLLSRSLSPGL